MGYSYKGKGKSRRSKEVLGTRVGRIRHVKVHCCMRFDSQGGREGILMEEMANCAGLRERCGFVN